MSTEFVLTNREVLATTASAAAPSTSPTATVVPLVRFCMERRLSYARARQQLIAGALDGYQDPASARLYVRVAA